MRLFQIILNISCKVYFYLEINFSEGTVWISKNSCTYSITASSLHWISTQLEKKPNKYYMVIFSLSCLFLTYMYHHSERNTYKNVYFSTIYILHVLVCLYFKNEKQSFPEKGTLTRSVVNVSFTETPFPINTAPSGVTRLFLQKKKLFKK